MSLLRLLSAGKSWVGSNDSAARYQMGDPRAMPRFGSAKNPFARERVSEAPPSTKAAPSETPARIAPPAELPKPARRTRTPMHAALGWLRKCLAWFRRKPQKAAKPVVPQFAKGVQGELSLESVKVVRNDLSDTDLEIVTARPRPSTGGAKPNPPIAQREPAGAVDREAECIGARKP